MWFELFMYGTMIAFSVVLAALLGLNAWITYLRWRGRHEEADRICMKCEPYVRYFFLY